MEKSEKPERSGGKADRPPAATRPLGRVSEDFALADAGAENKDTRARFAYLLPMHPSLSVITKRSDFLAANRGMRNAKPGFVLLTRPNEGKGKRYGITVTKKIGNAVVRNRMKRRFRELLWAALPEAGLADHDHILIGRGGGVERDFAALADELGAALARAGKGEGDRARRPRHNRSRRA